MRRRLIRSCRVLAVAILLTASTLAWAFASPDEEGEGQRGIEYQTKAAFLFNFAKFVNWPPRKFTQPDSPLIIGVVGLDPFDGLLEEQVQDQRINDRTVIVCHLQSVQEMRKCHIVFVCRSEAERLAPILTQARGNNVLTVGETDQFISRGGIINFVMVDGAVRFQINDSAARHAGLKISSKLSSLALPIER
jgi:hypothetical protein